MLAEVRDRSHEPWPDLSNHLAVLEEEQPRLLDDFLRFFVGQPVPLAGNRVQELFQAEVQRLEVERLLARRQSFDFRKQPADGLQNLEAAGWLANHHHRAATENFLVELGRAEAGERDDARARADAPDAVEQRQPLAFRVKAEVGDDHREKRLFHERLGGLTVERARAFDLLRLEQAEESGHDRLFVIDNQHPSVHVCDLTVLYRAAQRPQC